MANGRHGDGQGSVLADSKLRSTAESWSRDPNPQTRGIQKPTQRKGIFPGKGALSLSPIPAGLEFVSVGDRKLDKLQSEITFGRAGNVA